jgi:hypothetical protein
MNTDSRIQKQRKNHRSLLVRIVFVLLLSFVASFAEDIFSSCRFHFGAGDQTASGNPAIMKEVDYLTSWAGYEENFNMGNFFKHCKDNDKTPVIMAYIIAFAARRDMNLQDCNVGSPNLCQKGANYIRERKARILGQYAKYAAGAAQSFGTAKPMLWCMEPDYIQYADSKTQEGGGLTSKEAGAMMNEIIDTILAHSPMSVFSIDISPWKDINFYKDWYGAMDMEKITFINTSGGGSRPDQEFICNNNASEAWSQAYVKWKSVYETFGKPIIADAGYGAGGGSTGYDGKWLDLNNLKARIPEGVVAVSYQNPTSAYSGDITKNRSQIPTPPNCPDPPTAISFREIQKKGSIKTGSTATGMVEIIDLSGKVVSKKPLCQIRGQWDSWLGDNKVMSNGIYTIRVSGGNQFLQKRISVIR